ncbi:zinc transporter ZIP13 [Thrips palmi]|uniref:Zinc transporter ZIP13 n=1 Tax=Thrips palmi TaxID=161013 RepID=A0A6P8ZKU5_THRPL|nr:zinc transporter ZIP13 [Thrips palmi]
MCSTMNVNQADSSSCVGDWDWANVTTADTLYRRLFLEVSLLLPQMEYHPWLLSAIGSVVVGLSGVLPLLVIPIETGANMKHGAGARTLKVLLSFAVGGLLGDVFLHLLPEAWASHQKLGGSTNASFSVGGWVLTGLVIFVIAEKLFAPADDDDEDEEEEDEAEENENVPVLLPVTRLKQSSSAENNNNVPVANGKAKVVNGHVPNGSIATNSQVKNGTNSKDQNKKKTTLAKGGKQMSGYLNLMANSIDNFTHGLAVGGSFLISFRVGALSTLAILVHEIPHEVGDFAILLRAGFSRWEAAWAQLCTAFTGLMGAMVAVAFSEASGSIESRTSWILPFTAGGFLHIALVTVLPELLREKNSWESFKQMSSLIAGIAVMAAMTVLVE